MSGHSGSTTCPNCGESCSEYTDYKPFDYTMIECLECGLIISPSIGFMTLEEINDIRQENSMKLLDKLPVQDFDF